MQKSNLKRGARAFSSEMLLGRDQNRLGVGPRVSIILFFLLLLAGQYSLDRLDPRLDFASDLGQLNWSLFFFSLLAAVAVNRGVKGARIWTKKGKMFLVTVVALHLYLALSILWAPAPQDAFRDILLLVLLAAIVALAPFVFGWRPEKAMAFLFRLCVVAAGLYAIAGMSEHWWENGRMAVFGGGPNIFARVMSSGIICATYLWNRTGQLPWLAAIPPCFGGLVLSGSRGGMVAFVCSYVFFLVLTLRKTRAWLVKWSLLGGLLILLAMSDYGVRILRPVLTGRFMVYTVQQKQYGERDQYAAAAWQLFRVSPIFGMGIDGFKELSGTGAVYAHNLELAVASEGGGIGLFFLLLSGLALVAGRRAPKSLEHLTALSLAVFYFGASQFSGGFYDCRWLWVLGALYLLPVTTREPTPLRSRLNYTL